MKTQSGSRLTSLELSSVDEMNLAAVVMIGVNCLGLQHLALSCCHYTQVGNLTNLISETVFPPRRLAIDSDWKTFAQRRLKQLQELHSGKISNFLTLVTIVGSGG